MSVKLAHEILQPALSRRKAMEPLIIADAMNRLSKVDINVVTHGGGIMDQSGAIRTAIARGLVLYNGGAGPNRNCVTNSCVSTARCWSTTHAERSPSTNSAVALAASRSRTVGD